MNDKKVIWITGASSGIGRSLALKFAKEGWTVAASARRENLLQELHTENENIHSFPLDVTNTEQCKAVFNDIVKKFENIEICVFGTGIPSISLLLSFLWWRNLREQHTGKMLS